MFEVEATSQLLLPNGRPVGIINQSTVATGDIANDREVQRLASELGSWIEKSRQSSQQGPNMFNRSVYQVANSPYDQMRAARHAVREDDVVSGVADATEALAFDGGLKWESSNSDDADVFNQLSADLNLDGKIREMWRECFTVDQFVCAKLWDKVDYTVRGNTEKGNKKKKKYTVWVPSSLTILRPENVVPIGYGPLRKDDLAWQATEYEIGNYNRTYSGNPVEADPLMQTFFTGIYQPGIDEQQELTSWGVNIERLLRMNPDWVFRHTSTRPDYQKFPDLRLRGVFALLDLKRQLIASDRASLIGAANYILLIRKGSKEVPATNEEITNLKSNYNFLAKLPVIISDHRLEIDVIAPKLDFVLRKDAYDALDTRILHRVLATFTSGQRSSGSGGVSSEFSDILSSSIQSRRHMIKRSLERQLAKAICDHPRNKGVFEERPSLVFTPRTVSVGISQPIMQAMLALRTQREISRDTILEFMGLDQATEAQRLEVEEKVYDDIFQTQIPFASPAAGGSPAATKTAAPSAAPAKKAATATPNKTAEAPAVSGARGGRPAGGGTAKKSPQAQSKPQSGNGNTNGRS